MKAFVLLILWLTGSLLNPSFARRQNEGYKKKLSLPLQKESSSLKNNRERIFWLVTQQPDTLKNLLKKQAVVFTIRHKNIFVVTTSRLLLDSLFLPSPYVQFIDKPRTPHVELALGVFDISLNNIHRAQKTWPAITGQNLVVSVKEDKPDSSDIDFTGRYLSTPLSSRQQSGHAGIMATIIAGAGNSFYTGKGVAPGAFISSSDFASLLPDPDTAYRTYAIRVQNHSYGTGLENYYGADAYAYDASVVSNPALVHVFSAGNAGNETDTVGIYAGITQLANLTGSFKMAKNILTVGAVDSFNRVALLSSKGPAYDGRIKPELVAFGEEGSSGAAALTSGAALLIQQAYYDLQHDRPPASLVKAALLNSAADIDLPGPDFLTGFGNLNTYKAIETIVQNRWYTGSVAQGEQQSFVLNIPPGISSLKITLCWTDPPAGPNAAKALVNDVDMELVNNTTNEVWLPWTLNSYAHKDSLLLPAQRKKDSLNNAEQISINAPAAGEYSIRIKGFSIQAGSQPYSIAYQPDTANRFTWNFPVAKDQFAAGANNFIRWTSTYPTPAGKLEYSLNKGVSWQTLNNATPLSTSYFTWQAPDTFCTVLFRMTIGHTVFETDTCSVSWPLPVKVGFNCTDSVLLYWDKIKAASSYTLYRLGDRYLEAVSTTQDTSFIIQSPQSLSSCYTVQPVFAAATAGIKAYTFNYNTQGAGCYIKKFLADIVNNSFADIAVELGTYYNLAAVTVEKLSEGSSTALFTINPVTSFEYRLKDEHLTNGINTYRLKLALQDGSFTFSQPVSVYYFQQGKYLVFPNPLPSTRLLQVLAEDPFHTQLQLFNAYGQKVLERVLNNSTSSISVQHLPRGLYFVIILKEGRKDYEGKVIVQ